MNFEFFVKLEISSMQVPVSISNYHKVFRYKYAGACFITINSSSIEFLPPKTQFISCYIQQIFHGRWPFVIISYASSSLPFVVIIQSLGSIEIRPCFGWCYPLISNSYSNWHPQFAAVVEHWQCQFRSIPFHFHRLYFSKRTLFARLWCFRLFLQNHISKCCRKCNCKKGGFRAKSYGGTKYNRLFGPLNWFDNVLNMLENCSGFSWDTA